MIAVTCIFPTPFNKEAICSTCSRSWRHWAGWLGNIAAPNRLVLPSWPTTFRNVADVWESENCLFSKILIRRHILIFCCNFSSKTVSLIWHTVISASNLTFLLKSFGKLFNLDIKAAQHHVHHWESTSVKYSLLLLEIYFTFNSSVSVDTILHKLSSLWNWHYIFSIQHISDFEFLNPLNSRKTCIYIYLPVHISEWKERRYISAKDWYNLGILGLQNRT